MGWRVERQATCGSSWRFEATLRLSLDISGCRRAARRGSPTALFGSYDIESSPILVELGASLALPGASEGGTFRLCIPGSGPETDPQPENKGLFVYTWISANLAFSRWISSIILEFG